MDRRSNGSLGHLIFFLKYEYEIASTGIKKCQRL